MMNFRHPPLSEQNEVAYKSEQLILPEIVEYKSLLQQDRTQPFICRPQNLKWPAFEKWTPQFFSEAFCSLPVLANIDLSDSTNPYTLDAVKHTKKIKMWEFIHMMEKGQSCYLTQMDIRNFYRLNYDIDFRQLVAKGHCSTNLWIGNNTRSGLHYDFADNFFIQVYGEKSVILISPDDTRKVYPFSDNITKSQLDPDYPDLKRYPRFGKVKSWATNLSKGDILFIPKGWWHFIKSPGISISVNCWHGKNLPNSYQIRTIFKAGLGVSTQVFRDFFWYGMLNKPYQSRLFSPPPTGLELWQSFISFFK